MAKKKKEVNEHIHIESIEESIPLPEVAIVVAGFYPHIAKMLVNGAINAFKDKKLVGLFEHGVKYRVINVAGALEIPSAIASLSRAYDDDGFLIFSGFVALGCVIRGETSHYDIVAEQSASGLMRLGIDKGLAIGNGILTVENEDQAIKRADPKLGNKGYDAVKACLELMALQIEYDVDNEEIDMMHGSIDEQLDRLREYFGDVEGGIEEDDEEEDTDLGDEFFKKQEPN